ncbi:MAG: FecR domain-containing protein [Chloroherpetonaceae bacterium]
MSTTGYFTLLFLSFPLFSVAQPVIVVQCKGTVERTLSPNTWTAAKRADTLRFGEKLRTARNAQSIVRFEDGTILRIAERTEIEFVSPRQKNSREVNVFKGALTYDVKANPNEPFRFKSPTAVAAIKGTTGSFTTDGKATNFIVEASDAKDDVAEFETERGEKKSVGIGEVAVLNRSGKLALRDILDRERRAIQNEVNDMRRAVEEELRKIKEEVEQIRRETETQLKGDADSLKQNLEQLKQDQQKEADDIKREIDKTKEEMQKEKDEIRKLFDR